VDKIEKLKATFDPSEMAEIMDALQAARRMGDKFGANSRTVEAVVSAYNANLLALQDCNTRMGEIRALGR